MNSNAAIPDNMAVRLAMALRDAVDFPTFLKMARLANGMSRLELAAKAETSRSHLSMLESGKRTPGPAVLGRLASALELSADHYAQFLRLAAEAQIKASYQRQAMNNCRPAKKAVLPPMTEEELAIFGPIIDRIRNLAPGVMATHAR
jgi:transcriptional regulator with XRE-family HTH domain